MSGYSASNIALKRKREDIPAPRIAPSNRGQDAQKIRELLKIYQLFQDDSVECCNISSETAKLLPSGDLVLVSDKKISLILNLFDPKRALISIPTENFQDAGLDRKLSMSLGYGGARGLIACSTEGDRLHNPLPLQLLCSVLFSADAFCCAVLLCSS
jgi:hypothetical protein